MTRDEKNRFVVRTSTEAIARTDARRQALDRARQEARRRGCEIEVNDTRAQIGAVCLWIVSPSGAVQAAELRTVESDKRELQAGGGTR